MRGPEEGTGRVSTPADRSAEALRTGSSYRGRVADILEQGRDRAPRPARLRWVAAAVGVAIAAGATVASLVRAGQERPAADAVTTADGPAMVRPAPRALRDRPKQIRLVTLAPGAAMYDVDAGQATPLRLPARVRPVDVDTVVALSRATVILARGRAWLVPYDGGAARSLGRADRLVAATGQDAVWLVQGRRVLPVDSTGSRVGPRLMVERGRYVVGAAGGQLVLSSARPGRPGRLEYGDPTRGGQRWRVSGSGLVHSVGLGAAAWSPCPAVDCEVLVTDLDNGFPEPLPDLPRGLRRSAPPVLAPDGRHFAVLAREPGSTTDVVVVGHLPGSGREDRTEIVARGLRAGSGSPRVHLAFAANSWLVVATGAGAAVLVGPGPHGQLRLGPALPLFDRLAVS